MSDSITVPVKVSSEKDAPRIRFEVTPIKSDGSRSRDIDVSRGPQISADDFHLTDVCEAITQIAQTIGKGLQQLKAKKTVIEFGVEIGAETGHLTAMVVKGTGSANLKITVEWS